MLNNRIRDKLNAETILLSFLASFPLSFILGYSNWYKGMEDFMGILGFGGAVWLHIIIACILWTVLAALSWFLGVRFLSEEKLGPRLLGLVTLAIITGIPFILAIEAYGEYIGISNILYMFGEKAAENLMNWANSRMNIAEVAAGFSAVMWVGLVLFTIGRVLFSSRIGFTIGLAIIVVLFFLPGIWSWKTGESLQDAKYVYGGLLLIGLLVAVYILLRFVFGKVSTEGGRGTVGYIFGKIIDLVLFVVLLCLPFYFAYREDRLGIKWAIIAALVAPVIGLAFYFSQSRKRQLF